jgi:hypothetical protein
MIWYAGFIYVAIGCWPAVLTWFALPNIHPATRFFGLLLCVVLWPLALWKRAV